jgi:hypothetical protein
MSAENVHSVRVFHSAGTPLATIDSAQVLCHNVEFFYVHTDSDANLPGFEAAAIHRNQEQAGVDIGR